MWVCLRELSSRLRLALCSSKATTARKHNVQLPIIKACCNAMKNPVNEMIILQRLNDSDRHPHIDPPVLLLSSPVPFPSAVSPFPSPSPIASRVQFDHPAPDISKKIIKWHWQALPITAELILYDSGSKTSQLPTSWHSFLSVLSAWYLSNRCSRSALSCSTSISLSLSWVLQLASPSRTHTNMGTIDSTAPSPWVWMTAC